MPAAVVADDEDADVAGEGACADVSVTCGEHDASCHATSGSRTSQAGAGTCAGRSEEFWDSGLRVNCWSRVPPSSDDVPRCIVNAPPVGCVPPCQPLGSFEFCAPGDPVVSAHIWSDGAAILGAVCTGSDCVAVAPACEIHIHGGVSCRIGS